ncbi:MAG: trans-aconitate 2-methyltransferase [Vicinamibacterales bacterium]
MASIYDRPSTHDLEHEGDAEDIAFYIWLIGALKPSRVLELAAGTGRVTIPLVERFPDLRIVGLDAAPAMLAEAERKRQALAPGVRARVAFIEGDMRHWQDAEPFDLILTPCSSLAHLHEIDDQVATWRRAYANLVPGGRFVTDLTMPDLAAFAESLRTPPRTLLEIDIDTCDPRTGDRLLRYKTTQYVAHEQLATIRFVYDQFPTGEAADRYVSDFRCHVYFPREIELLFRLTGFTIEQRFGDYGARRPRASSRQIITVGRR